MQAASYTDCMRPSPAPEPDRAPRLLALDTATERLCVAVVDGAQEWVGDEAGGPLASQRLLPLAFDLLQRAGLALGELDAIAFGRGPGAFTGLRTACSVAQGLALGADLPVLSIDSLAVVAEDAFAHFHWPDRVHTRCELYSKLIGAAYRCATTFNEFRPRSPGDDTSTAAYLRAACSARVMTRCNRTRTSLPAKRSRKSRPSKAPFVPRRDQGRVASKPG